jgi:hypothetical protein
VRPPLVVGVVKRDATPKRRMNILGSPLVFSLQIVKFSALRILDPRKAVTDPLLVHGWQSWVLPSRRS